MTEMDAVCLKYRPPDPPIFSNTLKEARDRMLKWRNDNPSYQDYAKLCNLTDVDGPSIRTSTLSTSTPDPVVSTVTTLPTVTTEVTNVSSVNNDTFLIPSTDLENLNPSSGDQAWIAAVVIPIVLIIAVVIVAWVIKRKKASQYEALFERFWCFYKGPQRHRSVTHLCDLQSHENVNYLNNKAVKGEKWAGAHQNVNYLDNKAEKGEKWKGNSMDKEKWDSEKLSKNQDGVHGANLNVQNNVELNELSLKNGHNLTHHSKQVPAHQGLTDDEVIYANSQFEKVAKSASKKPPLEKSHSVRDITPPVDKKTSDMYYIDENPYDRVDRRERPVPKKRNKVMHQEPR